MRDCFKPYVYQRPRHRCQEEKEIIISRLLLTKMVLHSRGWFITNWAQPTKLTIAHRRCRTYPGSTIPITSLAHTAKRGPIIELCHKDVADYILLLLLSSGSFENLLNRTILALTLWTFDLNSRCCMRSFMFVLETYTCLRHWSIENASSNQFSKSTASIRPHNLVLAHSPPILDRKVCFQSNRSSISLSAISPT